VHYQSSIPVEIYQDIRNLNTGKTSALFLSSKGPSYYAPINIEYFREHGQGTIEELQARDFRRELEEREQREREKDNKNVRGRIQEAPQ